ncbi:sigma-54-dependent Fis family transcriptional regulator, partial [bacterium]
LDEIGELPLPLQPKLLRVLETRQVDPLGGGAPVAVDFRLVCASNRDLAAEVDAGRFRADLFHRLDVIRVTLPALRERPEDIPLLWSHFTRLHAGEDRDSEPALLEELATRPWPGNVRELKNLNQRLVLLTDAGPLRRADLLRHAPLATSPPPPAPTGATGSSLPLSAFPEDGFSLPDLEKEVVRRALERCGGNRTRAAAYLDIPRHILVYRISKYGLE